jgi:NAD(P)-dependent dehydrogenase (short-subunit alcohol dehydrogenase family)
LSRLAFRAGLDLVGQFRHAFESTERAILARIRRRAEEGSTGMGRLENKVALITGGASGMGMVASQLFASEGAKVVLTDVSDDAGEQVAEKIRADGGQATYVHADVSSESDAKAMVDRAVETYGGLTVLYNNAGVMLDDDGSVHSTDESIWDKTLAINVKGVAHGCKYGIPEMIESGGGSIINVASFVAWMGAATSQTAYTASKGAVLAMTREIAVEYARKNVRCNALCPGPIDTPLLAELLSDPQRRQRRFVHIPMGRLGRAEELANAALFLASDDSSYMTGTSLIVDGGITAAYVTPEE